MHKILCVLVCVLLLIFLKPALAAEECAYVCDWVCSDEQDDPQVVYPDTVVLNELLPLPLEGQEEFIELKNTGTDPVDLNGWYLTDASGKKYTMSETFTDFLNVSQSISKIYLNNEGDTVNLYQPDDVLVMSVSYDNTGEAGESYCLDNQGAWQWSTANTPGAENSITASNESSEIPEAGLEYSKLVRLNEILPNPVGSDSEEWLELYNADSQNINLIGWTLTDGTTNFIIENDIIIEAGQYWVFYNVDTNISLNNNGDSVTLLDPTGSEISIVSYASGAEGESYAYLDELWSWTNTPTPNAVNQITTPTDNSDPTALENSLNSIAEVRKLALDSSVQVQGVVTAAPGILGTQIFYVEDETSGIQIYSSKKEFPELKVGDLVTVSGTLSEAYAEMKINISSADSVQVIGNQELQIGEVDKLGEELEGQIIKTSSQLLQKDGSKLNLTNGVLAYIKSTTGISAKDLKEGDELEVTGIVSDYKGEYRLLPRSQDDLKVISSNASDSGLISSAQAAGSGISSTLAPGSDGKDQLRYLEIIAVILCFAIGLVIGKKIRGNRIADDTDKY